MPDLPADHNEDLRHCTDAPFCACGRPVHARGLCQRHYTARYRGQTERPRCAVPGCPRPAYGTGARCWSHAVWRVPLDK